MAKDEKEQKKHRRGGFGTFAYGYIMRPLRVTIFLIVIRILGIIIALSLAFFLLSGGINQVKTGKTLVEIALDIGENISHFFGSLLNGTSPFKFTDDGVYFKDADVPESGLFDGQDGVIDGGKDNKLDEWKDNWAEESGASNASSADGNAISASETVKSTDASSASETVESEETTVETGGK